MASYKNIEIDDGLMGVIRHMDTVEEYREVLQGLQLVWDNLTLLGQMSGAGTDMTATRQSFNALTGQLINQLGAEILKKSVQEMRAKAQVAIDILVRNLFERTADIGFLATDDDKKLVNVPKWDFGDQGNLAVAPMLRIGKDEVIKTRCSFNNTTDKTVVFGESTNEEMCIAVLYYYPEQGGSSLRLCTR